MKHGLFFIDEEIWYMTVDRAMEIKLTTNHDVFDLNASLDQEYDELEDEAYWPMMTSRAD